MLNRVTLENIAIIDSLTVDFAPGINIITGESGSGKSILLDGIQRVFERRIKPADLLKHGQVKGRMELEFNMTALGNREAVLQVLEVAGVDPFEEGVLIVSRELSPTGSRCRVNGAMVSAEVLESLGNALVEMYGQHDLNALFSTAKQRDLVDACGGDPVRTARQAVRESYALWQQAKTQLEHTEQAQLDRERQLDLVTWQLDEIAKAQVTDAEEDDQLKAERERLSHVDSLRKSLGQTVALLAGDDGYETSDVMSLLQKAQKTMSASVALDSALGPQSDQVDGVLEEVRTVAHSLSRYVENLNASPERLAEIVDRLDVLEKLKRKYGGTLASVMDTELRLVDEHNRLMAMETELERLTEAVAETQAQFLAQCAMLTELRTRIAAQLATQIEPELKTLHMPAATFEIALTPCDPGESGQEQITFLFSANPGEPLRPLGQVASGGELARFMLALKLHTAHAGSVGTLILDEIDTGMSGLTVRTLADKLAGLSNACQMIVVTHQPIMAARGDRHLHVEKILLPDSVCVMAEPLETPQARTAVLSRLATGFADQDETSQQFVRQLLGA